MHRRRITRALGAAAGGLLGAALFPAAIAFADDYDIGADPNSPEVITGLYGFDFGFDTTPPAVNNSVDGDQLFDVDDTTVGTTTDPDVVGTFEADESTSSDGFGDTNQELLVTSDVSGTAGTAAGDTPPVGSVFDFYTFGDGSFENIYSDLPSPSGNLISDTLVTPFGDFSIPDTFDAASAVSVYDATNIPIADGDIVLDPGHVEHVTAINGFSPLTIAVQGVEKFDVDSASGATLGTFNADEATTTDGFGTVTQALLVTKDVSGTAGGSAGDVPPVGSVFNTVTLDGYENIYSDIASTTPGGSDTITDTVVTPYGDFNIPTTFDATAEIAAANAAAIDMPDGYDIVSDPATETLTGVNGLPPIDVAEEGTHELFNIDSTAGTSVGSFDADVTTTADAFGNTTQTILVTSDLTGTAGTAAGDVPAVGSELDTVTFGDTGFELIYSDLVSSSGNAMTETLVTPLGDITFPTTFDAAAALAADVLSAG
jgi:hypothetical protein